MSPTLSTTKRKIILQPITETILQACGGSTTELARRLTVASADKFYTPNMVTHWCRTGKVPPEHAAIVASEFDLKIEDVVPELFGMHHTNNNK